MLLDWPQSQSATLLLSAFVAGRIKLAPSTLGKLAPALEEWPTKVREQQIARNLLPHLTPLQIRQFLPTWIDAALVGDIEASAMIDEPRVQELLRPQVQRAALAGDYNLLGLLRPDSSLAGKSLRAHLAQYAPNELSRLQVPPKREEKGALSEDPLEDPIADKGLEELIELIGAPRISDGVAVRAIAALSALGKNSAPGLDTLVTDRRSKVRSAALRALRKVASKETCAEAALRALKMESRGDVAARLMRSLAHAHYEPALDLLIGHLTDGDYRLRRGAESALRAWGSDAIPALEHAARKARPDRRPALLATIADLEA